MTDHDRRWGWLGSLAATFLLASAASAQVTIEWITVGDPGNACDVQAQGCFGAVSETYRISKTEVTNAQYAAFLNAVAVSDANALYDTNMGSGLGGITRSGSSGSYSYDAIGGREDMPVSFVTFWDAARFANWLHNGQPTGLQGIATTEAGAYTLTTGGISANTIVRNEGAVAYVPSEDEWYKAAYYDTVTTMYFDFPAGSDTETVCAVAGSTANTANCDSAVGDLTDVASYTGAASPNGTFDQGGNVWEWNEAISSVLRGRRGGHLDNAAGFLAASQRGAIFAGSSLGDVGFRVGSPTLPLPSVPSSSPLGLLMLVSLLGFLGSKRASRAR